MLLENDGYKLVNMYFYHIFISNVDIFEKKFSYSDKIIVHFHDLQYLFRAKCMGFSLLHKRICKPNTLSENRFQNRNIICFHLH